MHTDLEEMNKLANIEHVKQEYEICHIKRFHVWLPRFAYHDHGDYTLSTSTWNTI